VRGPTPFFIVNHSQLQLTAYNCKWVGIHTLYKWNCNNCTII